MENDLTILGFSFLIYRIAIITIVIGTSPLVSELDSTLSVHRAWVPSLVWELRAGVGVLSCSVVSDSVWPRGL